EFFRSVDLPCQVRACGLIGSAHPYILGQEALTAYPLSIKSLNRLLVEISVNIYLFSMRLDVTCGAI
ncbi:MAG: hypothetical protein AB2814_04165, partial [Candidatus Sedimenticola endophacoides]